MENNYKKLLVEKWKEPSKKNKVIILIIIVALFIGLRFIVYSDGEINIYYIHSMDIPVIIAGIVFGIKGGILSGLAAGIMLSPFTLPVLREVGLLSLDNIINWGIRTGVFVLQGVIVGISYELLKNNFNKLEKDSFFNAETSLPNRNKFIKDIEDLSFLENKESGYFILISIENYYEIINIIGYHFLEDFIQQFSKKVQKSIDRNLNIYHIYGNKLGVLITDTNREKIILILDKLIKLLEDPVVCEFKPIPIYLDTYLGITPINRYNIDKKTIVQEAYIASEKAQQLKSNYLFYDSRQKQKERHTILLGEIKTAIEKSHFILYYMPKLDLHRGEITGVEALIRWQHPERGLILPNDFIPQVEKTALINDLTYWVIEKVAEDLLKFEKENMKLNMAINIAPRNLRDKEFPEKLEKIITQKNISPQRIELELTETEIMEELKAGKNVLDDLAEKGFKISLDDFGTGYSSLAYLKKLPIDYIKVDRSFVKDILVDSESKELVNAAIQLGHILNKEVIAEGVDSQKGLNLIKNMGCDFAQGYFIGKPVPFDEFIEIHLD